MKFEPINIHVYVQLSLKLIWWILTKTIPLLLREKFNEKKKTKVSRERKLACAKWDFESIYKNYEKTSIARRIIKGENVWGKKWTSLPQQFNDHFFLSKATTTFSIKFNAKKLFMACLLGATETGGVNHCSRKTCSFTKACRKRRWGGHAERKMRIRREGDEKSRNISVINHICLDSVSKWRGV